MSNQNGPRDYESVLASRYWLTESGMAATDAHWAEQNGASE